jgi:hypothetical protein
MTIPVKSTKRDEVEDVTKGIVKYLKDRLKFNVHRVEHFAHGMKRILGYKEKDLNEDDDEDQNLRNHQRMLSHEMEKLSKAKRKLTFGISEGKIRDEVIFAGRCRL